MSKSSDSSCPILYLGYRAEHYASHFLPRFFSHEIQYLDWYVESELRPVWEIKRCVLERIMAGDFAALVIGVAYDPLFYADELDEIATFIPIVGVFGDDTVMPAFTTQLASKFSLVLTTDPLQIDRYLSVGVHAQCHLFDINPSLFVDSRADRDVDVLFFGKASKRRRSEIDWLKGRLSDFAVVDITDSQIALVDLIQLLNRSRITINWNWVETEPFANNVRDPLYANYIQLKGRVFEAALCGCLPLSTWCGAHERIFAEQLPTFSDREQLLELLGRYLSDETLRQVTVDGIKSMAISYIDQFKEVDLATLPAAKFQLVAAVDRSIDTTVATHRFLQQVHRLRKKEIRLVLSDARSVKYLSVSWPYVISVLLNRIRSKR